MPRALERLAVIEAEAPVREAAALMHTDLIVVSNHGAMVGVLTKTDIVGQISRCLPALRSPRTNSTTSIEIDEFVSESDIDQRYAIRPYCLVREGKVRHHAYAVIRETIRSMDMVAIGRLVRQAANTSSRSPGPSNAVRSVRRP